MWRKIRSNRDPRDTLYSEINREFGGYFIAAGNGLKKLLQANPKVAWISMIVIMLVSAVLSFTTYRRPEQQKVGKVQAVDPVGDGFTEIWQTAEKIRSSLLLKKHIDSLSSKEQLNANDSLMLENALDSLQHLQQ